MCVAQMTVTPSDFAPPQISRILDPAKVKHVRWYLDSMLTAESVLIRGDYRRRSRRRGIDRLTAIQVDQPDSGDVDEKQVSRVLFFHPPSAVHVLIVLLARIVCVNSREKGCI